MRKAQSRVLLVSVAALQSTGSIIALGSVLAGSAALERRA